MAVITKDMNILEVVQKFPESYKVFAKYGLGCIGCVVAAGESVADGISAHGLDVDVLVQEMNDLIEKKGV